ncbi:MAG TPA: hypothetical protein VLL08_22985 [Kineosporiaceae bacterium]|nr:hypothetical protein [Kineosporiaceae bacterium]
MTTNSITRISLTVAALLSALGAVGAVTTVTAATPATQQVFVADGTTPVEPTPTVSADGHHW